MGKINQRPDIEKFTKIVIGLNLIILAAYILVLILLADINWVYFTLLVAAQILILPKVLRYFIGTNMRFVTEKSDLIYGGSACEVRYTGGIPAFEIVFLIANSISAYWYIPYYMSLLNVTEMWIGNAIVAYFLFALLELILAACISRRMQALNMWIAKCD